MECINDYEKLAAEGLVTRNELKPGKVEFVFKDSARVIFSPNRIEIRQAPVVRMRYTFDPANSAYTYQQFWNSWGAAKGTHWLNVKSRLLSEPLDPEHDRKP